MRTLLAISVVAVSLLTDARSVHADDASHRQAVLEMFALVDMGRMMDESMNALMKSQLQVNPSLAGFHETFKRFFNEHLSWTKLQDEFVAIYMQTFTEPEIREIVAFYKTPVGRKSLVETPKLMQQGAMIGTRRVQQHLPELQQAIERDEAKRKQQIKRAPTKPLAPGRQPI